MKSLMVIGFMAFFMVSCTSSGPSAVGTANAAASGTFIEKLSCGESFSASGWGNYAFAYEVLDKTDRGHGYKVKTLANVNGRMIHLDCARNLPSRDAAISWLVDHGYWLGSDGPEPGGASGNHRTVDRGPLYKVPDYLYK